MNRPIILLLAFAAACASSSVKKDAFDSNRMQATTMAGGAPHMVDVTVAVLPLSNYTGDPGMDIQGTRLAERISTLLATRPGMHVVERSRMDKIFSENKLALSGAVDNATAVQIGRLLGANVMAFGGFSKLEGEARMDLRLVSVETGEIVGGALEQGKTLAKLDDMADDAAGKLADGIAAKGGK